MLVGVGGSLIAYSELIHVKCPKCNSCPKIIFSLENSKGHNEQRYLGHESKRLLCVKYGLTKEIHPKKRWDNLCVFNQILFDEKQGIDWYFGLPLYLQTKCCGHTLWFLILNTYIEHYIKEHIRPTF